MRLILSLLLVLSWSGLAAQQIDVQNYDISLTINPPGDTLDGHTVVTLNAIGGSLDEVTLNLSTLTVSAVEVDGTPVTTYTQIGDALIIPLPSTLNDGQSADIRVDYNGTPFQDTSGLGGWYQGNITFNIGVGLTAQPPNLGRVWFPGNDNFEDKATFDFRITTDTVNEAICGGELIGTINNGDGTETWVWRQGLPITTYNASVAVGDYGVFTENYVSDLTGTPIPLTFYAPVSGTGNIADVPNRIGMIEPALQIFEDHYGAYPQDRIGFVAVGDFPAAMEHVENIALPRLLLFAGGFEEVYVHELSHMWWGGNVNCASAQDMWLNEGLATHSESLFYESRDGEEAGRDYRRHNYLLSGLFEAHIDDNGYHAVSGFKNPQPPEVVYGTTNYYKAAAVIHTLRKYMGDQAFFDGLKSIQSTLAPQAIDSEEFRLALEASSGQDLSAFFDAWVYTPGHIDFALEHLVITDGPMPEASVTIRQRIREKPTLADANRVPVRFIGDNGQTQDEVVTFDGASGSGTFTLNFEPVAVFVDPAEDHLGATLRGIYRLGSGNNIAPAATDARLIVGSTSDSALVQLSAHYVRYGGLGILPEGAWSGNRFWTVSGDVPDGFPLTLRFSYSDEDLKEGNLEGEPEDSLALFFRAFGANNFVELTAADGLTHNIFTAGDGEGVFSYAGFQQGTYVIGMKTDLVGREEADQNAFTLTPNPAHTQTRLEFSQPTTGELVLTDLRGRTLQTHQLEAARELEVDVQGLSRGIYILQLNSETAIGTRRLVVE